MPVPGCAIDQDLAVFDAPEGDEANDSCGQAEDAGEEMKGVGASENVKRVATVAAGLEGESLERELVPCKDLAAEEERAQNEGCQQPGQGAARGGLAQTEPLLHGVDGVEHVAAGDLNSYRAEHQERGVEPKDRRDSSG